MNKKEEFDMEFDFEKEYGIDPEETLDEEPTEQAVEEFDLIPEAAPAAQEEEEELDFLSDDFLASLGIVVTSEDEAAEAEEIPTEMPALATDFSDEEDEELLSLFEDENLDEEPDEDMEDDLEDLLEDG